MTDNFDKKKIIEALRAQGVSDKEIEKLYGPLPKKPPVAVTNAAKNTAYKQQNAWKYDNKHKRPVRPEDADPDYEPIEELRKKTTKKPRISKKKPKKPKPVKNDWNAASEARLKALYEAGYSTEEMANEFKTTKDAITGKLARMRKAGWKGTIGTTHNPLPKPKPNLGAAPKSGTKLSPAMKRFLASALETNFGVAGRYLGRKWGLYEDKKLGKGIGGGGSPDVTAAVIKSNEMVVTALTKLDTALRRGTSSLTKSLAMATSKMTDAVNNAVEMIHKTQNSAGTTPGASPGKSSIAGGSGGAGMIAALLGGAGLAMLLGSRADAHANPSDMVEPEENDRDDATQTEAKLREEGAPKPSEQTPEIEIKVKELKFNADDITFEADEFKFTDKNGRSTASPTGGQAASPEAPASSGGIGGMLDNLRGGPGGKGMFNTLADKLMGRSGGAGGPSGGPTPANTGGKASGTEAQRIQEAHAAIKEQLRAEGVPEANLDQAASHLVGQAISESGLNPNLSHDGGTGYGIYGARLDRRSKMLGWLKDNGYEQNSLAGQAKYMAHEAMSDSYKPSRDALMNATKENQAQVAQTLTHNFEAPAVENWQSRLSNAQRAGNTIANPPQTQTPDGSGIKITPGAPTNYDSQFSLGQGNRDPNRLNKSWSDSIQPQEMNPTTGKQLLEQQKEKDDSDNAPPANFNDRFNGDKRSDISSQRSFETTILETTGPNHFSDYGGLSDNSENSLGTG